MAIYEYNDANCSRAINLAVIVGIEHRSGKNTIAVMTQAGEDKHLMYADYETARAEYTRMLSLMD